LPQTTFISYISIMENVEVESQDEYTELSACCDAEIDDHWLCVECLENAA